MSNGICPSPPPDYDSDSDNGEMIDVYYKERFYDLQFMHHSYVYYDWRKWRSQARMN